jgi:hypothetical protein
MARQEYYEVWKAMAKRAIVEGRTTKCADCEDPIVPGDFVARGEVRRWLIFSKPVLVHAGFHYTMEREDAFCLTGAMGCGYWDGTKVISEHEALASRVMREGTS